MSEHLWEPRHDYYGPEASYWGAPDKQAPYQVHHDSWQEFMEEGMGDAPSGLNLLYRWDWHAWHIEFPEDHAEPCWELELFWMQPRHGIMARSVVKVTPEDEPAVRAWLKPHWEYMRELWAPIS